MYPLGSAKSEFNFCFIYEIALPRFLMSNLAVSATVVFKFSLNYSISPLIIFTSQKKESGIVGKTVRRKFLSFSSLNGMSRLDILRITIEAKEQIKISVNRD